MKKNNKGNCSIVTRPANELRLDRRRPTTASHNYRHCPSPSFNSAHRAFDHSKFRLRKIDQVSCFETLKMSLSYLVYKGLSMMSTEPGKASLAYSEEGASSRPTLLFENFAGHFFASIHQF